METIEQTTRTLKKRAIRAAFAIGGADATNEFNRTWNDQYSTWPSRHRLVMRWLHYERQATRNGVGQ